MIITQFGTFLCLFKGMLHHINLCECDNPAYEVLTIKSLQDFGFVVTEADKFIIIGCTEGVLSAEPGGNFCYKSVELIQTQKDIESLLQYYILFEQKEKIVLPLLPDIEEAEEISKIIHQTESPFAIDRQFEGNVRGLRALNKDYEYRYYSDRDVFDFIYENYGWEILKYYLKICPRYGAARADFFRYLCIYKCGGVYLDMKSGANKPLSEIINPGDKFLLSYCKTKKNVGKYLASGESEKEQGLILDDTELERSKEISYFDQGMLAQWFIICRAGHPLMKKVIKQVLYNISYYNETLIGSSMISVLRVTGSIMYSNVLYHEITRRDHNIKIIDIKKEELSYINIPYYKSRMDFFKDKVPFIL